MQYNQVLGYFLKLLVPRLLLNPHLLTPMNAEAGIGAHPGCSLIMVSHWSTTHKYCWNKHYSATEPLNFKMINTPSLTNTPTDCGVDLLHYPTHQNKWSETEYLLWLWYFLLLLSYHVELLFQVPWGEELFKTTFCSSSLFSILPILRKKEQLFLHYRLTVL